MQSRAFLPAAMLLLASTALAAPTAADLPPEWGKFTVSAVALTCAAYSYVAADGMVQSGKYARADVREVAMHSAFWMDLYPGPQYAQESSEAIGYVRTQRGTAKERQTTYCARTGWYVINRLTPDQKAVLNAETDVLLGLLLKARH